MALTLTRDEALAVLQGCGFRHTEQWDDEKLAKSLIGIESVVETKGENRTVLADDDAAELFVQLRRHGRQLFSRFEVALIHTNSIALRL